MIYTAINDLPRAVQEVGAVPTSVPASSVASVIPSPPVGPSGGLRGPPLPDRPPLSTMLRQAVEARSTRNSQSAVPVTYNNVDEKAGGGVVTLMGQLALAAHKRRQKCDQSGPESDGEDYWVDKSDLETPLSTRPRLNGGLENNHFVPHPESIRSPVVWTRCTKM